MYLFSRSICLVVMLVVAGHAPAAQVEDNVDEELIVTATPLASKISEMVQPVSILSGDELRSRLAATIGETLALEPGVSSSDFGPGVGRPVIRGQGGGRVRMLQGGMDSMDASGVSADHAVSIDPFSARQIEVLRGPMTLAYGSGAIGGVVNVVDDRIPVAIPEQAFAGNVGLLTDSVSNEQTLASHLETVIGHSVWHFDGLDRATDDYKIPGFAAQAPDEQAEQESGTLANSNIDMQNFSLGGSFIGERGYFGLAASHFDDNYGVPGAGEESGVRIDMQQRRLDMQAALDDPFTGFEQLSVSMAHNDYQHVELEASGEPGTVFDNVESETRLELRHQPLQKWRGVIGVHYRDRDFSALGEEAFVPQRTTEALGLFAVERRDWQRWGLEAGWRVENQDVGIPNVSRSHALSAAALSGRYRFSDSWSLLLSANHAERAPSAEELFAYGPHLATGVFEVGQPDLRTEAANNVELGVRAEQQDYWGSINVFQNRIDDYVFLQSQDQNGDGIADRDQQELLLVNYSQRNAKFKGMEIETGVHLPAAAGYGDWDVRLFFDTVTGQLSGGEYLPRITPERLGVELDYHRSVWRTGLTVVKVDAQHKVAPLEEPTDSYTLVEADFGYVWSAGQYETTFFLKGGNLTDEEIRRHTSFLKNQAPLPGRTLQFGINLRF